ncbi:putative disease resistance RPP13-like protein 3 [Brachypodium distachyon]|uniref:AAA+ ATPase domain-containing protein n=1 Tax=Brachypodium distachyon TaxID=15368 RepID=A0A0Q3H090_BRADI|nr:putative disease resistance RPP13-like protein 3 [Brachypodium distachyon]KQJ86666.1 hypothetical protein BRADI_4g07017v3 [Brachypodium distachyon]|eukprot:XP_003575501.1 putative disease resistance RPP13-like protein 3 [Brachypodium distachyon]
MGDEQDPAVSASMGVMTSLLNKLTTLITDKNPNIKEALKDVTSLKSDLTEMLAILRKSTVRDDPDVQVKEWMRQFREVLYEAEDYIDDLCPPPAAGGEPPADNPSTATEKKGRSSSSKGLFSWKPLGSKKSDVTTRIKELRDRIKDARQRRLDYKLDSVEYAAPDPAAAIAGGAFDPRQLKLEAGEEEDDRPVGMDGPRDDLVDMLKDVEQEKQLKVVSIVGVGGVGKTTLAKEVCRTVPAQFDCRAFVKVGRNTPMKTTLLSILRQVTRGRGRQEHVDVGTSLDEQQAIDSLREFLGNKRYLVVVDDIWSISAWKIIKCALPESNCGSRVITTTRASEVADACSSRPFIHVMVPLSESDAEKLFLSRISCPREKYESELKGVFSNIFKACGGVPLAMVTIAGLLTRKFSELLSWEEVKSYAISAWDHYSALQGMKRILHVSYSDLSSPLKTCFLYLSCFPENHTIKKDRLIWRWIGEGFIPVKAEGKWITGEAYFDELVNRRLIQQEITDDDDEPLGCTVHGVVLDFIVSTSMEENFVTSEAGVRSMPRDVIRRFSLSCGDQEDDGHLVPESTKNVYLSKVRSLTVFGGAGWVMDLIKTLQFLRMLDLQDASKLADDHLNGIERLVHLKYMGLGGEGVKRLPEEIGFLRELETLDVRRTSIQELPASIVRLPNLARLLANDLPVPDGMENMTSLEEVHMVKLSDMSSPRNVAKLMRMKRLRTLGLNWCFDSASGGGGDGGKVFAKILMWSLGELGNSMVESLLLHVDGDTHRSLDVMAESWDPPYRLRRFLMTTSSNYHLPRVPPKMIKLEQLAHLKISIDQLGDPDLQLLGNLPSMVILKLQTGVTVPTTITDKMFQRLKTFCFMCKDGGLGFVLGKGAMAKLQDLQLSFKARVHTKPVGINYLSSLKQVQTTIDCEGSIDSDVKFAEEAITKQVSELHCKPTLELIRDHEDKMLQGQYIQESLGKLKASD